MKQINPMSFTKGDNTNVKDFRPKSRSTSEVVGIDPKVSPVPESVPESPVDPALLKDLKNDLGSAVLSTSQKSQSQPPISPPQP